VYGVIEGQLDLAPQPVAQALALHERHGVPQEPDAGLFQLHLAGVVHRQDVGVLQPRGGPDLAEKPLGAEGGRELRVKHLEGDGPIVLQIAGEIHGGHPSATEPALEQIAVARAWAS
jgi:hypothetical protein